MTAARKQKPIEQVAQEFAARVAATAKKRDPKKEARRALHAEHVAKALADHLAGRGRPPEPQGAEGEARSGRTATGKQK